MEKERSFGREFLSWVICIAVAVIIAFLLREIAFDIVRVDGTSMDPTLHDKETMFVNKLKKPENLERFDVVIVKYPGRDGDFVKRVVGLAGDRVAIIDGYLHINGERIVEDYTKDPVIYNNMDEVTVPEGTVFVMGDNRNDSMDSRSPSVGPIEYKQVVGKAVFVLFPINKIRGIK